MIASNRNSPLLHSTMLVQTMNFGPHANTVKGEGVNLGNFSIVYESISRIVELPVEIEEDDIYIIIIIIVKTSLYTVANQL
jgi:hypothetical protein